MHHQACWFDLFDFCIFLMGRKFPFSIVLCSTIGETLHSSQKTQNMSTLNADALLLAAQKEDEQRKVPSKKRY
jgi:hypothetical protein